jgi:hypothetical protein
LGKDNTPEKSRAEVKNTKGKRGAKKMNLKMKLCAGVILCLSLGLMGCGLSLTPLQLIVDASEAALPVLQAAGVPIPPLVVTYVGDVATCIGQLSGTPDAAQLTSVTSCLSSQVAPTLTGLPKAIITVVALLIKDVQGFLTKAPAMQTALAKTSLSTAQVDQVAKMQTKARTVAAVAKSMKR